MNIGEGNPIFALLDDINRQTAGRLREMRFAGDGCGSKTREVVKRLNDLEASRPEDEDRLLFERD